MRHLITRAHHHACLVALVLLTATTPALAQDAKTSAPAKEASEVAGKGAAKKTPLTAKQRARFASCAGLPKRGFALFNARPRADVKGWQSVDLFRAGRRVYTAHCTEQDGEFLLGEVAIWDASGRAVASRTLVQNGRIKRGEVFEQRLATEGTHPVSSCTWRGSLFKPGRTQACRALVQGRIVCAQLDAKCPIRARAAKRAKRGRLLTTKRALAAVLQNVKTPPKLDTTRAKYVLVHSTPKLPGVTQYSVQGFTIKGTTLHLTIGQHQACTNTGIVMPTPRPPVPTSFTALVEVPARAKRVKVRHVVTNPKFDPKMCQMIPSSPRPGPR